MGPVRSMGIEAGRWCEKNQSRERIISMERKKPRIAFFDFACCEGCQLTVLQMEESLLDLLEHVEVVAWREAMSGGSDDYDIAFCEGSISTREDEERIQRIRETAGTVVALGTCANIGCHKRPKEPVEHGGGAGSGLRGGGRSLRDPACPPGGRGDSGGLPDSRQPRQPSGDRDRVQADHHRPALSPSQRPVCVECKRNDHLCVLEKGVMCLGPVTRCGCDAICTAYGDACQGCRGLVDQANLEAAVRVITASHNHSIMDAVARRFRAEPERIRTWFSLYNGPDLPVEQETTEHGS